MGTVPESFYDVVKFVASKLEGHQYAIRGTASLVLQGLDYNVQDIDVLTDKEAAIYCNEVLKEILTDRVEYSESEKFKSYFGKFKINDILIEVCGDWQIKTAKGDWSEPFDASDDEIREILLGGHKVRVTTAETELRSYLLMGRWNVYHKLNNELRKTSKDKQKSLF